MERHERALKIKGMCVTEGWKLKRLEVEEQIKTDCDALIAMMAMTPEKITGRAAFRLGMRIKANREFLEGIDEDCK